MESLGYTFFEVFMQWVSDLKWVLIAFFVALMVKRILGFRPEERLMTVLMFSARRQVFFPSTTFIFPVLV